MQQNDQTLTSQYPLLSKINHPDDLKALPAEELAPLAEEIRQFLIERVKTNGGHLASNLGVVEMTLAIHRVFSTPHDHVIFDVGHQSYVHKLLTGRREQFSTLRQGGGLSGFPKREESEHDCFGTGHSSTSLSAALGFAEADSLSGSDACTVCVLGDGAYTGGMIHEALNNSRKRLRLIIILNENEMSISKNIGRFAKNLSHLRSTKGYFRTKNGIVSFLLRIPFVGPKMQSLIRRIKESVKAALYGSNYFENLGLYYLGPVDGNDEAAVELLLREAKASKQSCVIHLKTKKGKGYAPAEATPDVFHGMAPIGAEIPTETSFSEEMGKMLVELAAKDEKICAITAAMAGGTGLLPFRQAYPTRFFDVGIAEEHAVTFAAGLAANGYRPVVAIYSTFLQRAYDNVIHDVALQGLPVVFCVDRAGLNPSDGATHHGVFDVSFLSAIPNLTIYTPYTRKTLRLALTEALQASGPVAIRYPNGHEADEVTETFYRDREPVSLGVRGDYRADEASSLSAVIITHGRMVKEAIKAKKELHQEGIDAGLLLLEQLKPYEKVAGEVAELLPKQACKVILVEEEIRAGGMGMLLSDALSGYEVMKNKTVTTLALDDDFGIQTVNEPIWRSAGVDHESILRAVKEPLKDQRKEKLKV